MRAVGLGNSLHTVPQVDFEYLSDIADTLADDPNATLARKTRVPIPNELRGIQRDYAYVGRGYDTPSERVLRAASGEQNADMSNSGRLGTADWPASLLNPAPMDSAA
jgi:hypothetical protein